MTEAPYHGEKRMTYRWRMPEVGSFGFNACLTEMSIGEKGKLLRRFVFDEVVTVLVDQHIEVTPEGEHWLCNKDGGLRQIQGHWEKINEPIEED